jgi:hypothetical protein
MYFKRLLVHFNPHLSMAISCNLIGNTDNTCDESGTKLVLHAMFTLTTSRTSASVASLQGLLVAALAKVIGAGVGHDGTLCIE